MANNTGGHAFARMRRFLQGSGVEYRRTANLTGSNAVAITVPGMKSQDELISVLHLVASPITSIDELCTETRQAAVQASVSPAQAGADNLVKWTANTPSYEGAKGNSLSIEQLNGGASKPLTVSVISGSGGAKTKVSIQLATDSGSTATSTANQVIDAVAGDPVASQLMQGQSTEGTGDGLAVVYGATSLTGGTDINPANVNKVVTAPVQASATPTQGGGNNDILWVAMSPNYIGTKGNSLSVELLNGGASKTLAVDVINGTGGQETKVSVTLATDSGSTITSTANDVIDAVARHPQAKEMVEGRATEGTGDGLAVAVAATSLTSGADETVAILITSPDTTGNKVMVDYLSRRGQ